jgi:hypothetical protein
MPVGAYQFALSLDGKRPVRLDQIATIKGSSRLEGQYESHAGLRSAGWSIFAVSIAVGTAMMVAGPTTGSKSSGTWVIGGVVTSLLGGGIGLVMALSFDEASLRVEPE